MLFCTFFQLFRKYLFILLFKFLHCLFLFILDSGQSFVIFLQSGLHIFVIYYDYQNYTIINVIMLNIILNGIKPAFARSIRMKPHINNNAIKNETSQKQQQIIPKINRELKQRDQKLEDQVKKLVKQGFKEEHILNKFIKQSQQQNSGHNTNLNILKQDLLINQIMKKHNSSKKQVPIGSQYEQKQISQDQMDRKQQRILEQIRKQTGLINLKQFTFQQQVKNKYSSQMIQKAQQQNSLDLSYFKQLIGDKGYKDHLDETKLPLIKRRLHKNQSYSQIIQKDKINRKNKKIQNKLIQQKKQLFNQLEEQQRLSRMPKRSEMVAFEDEDYYKEKGLRQFEARQMIQSKQNAQIRKIGEEDMDKAADIHSIMIDEYEQIKYGVQNSKQVYDASSFGKFDAKLADIQNRLKKYGIQLDIQQLDGMKKQMLFSEKKDRQEQLAYQKYLMKKEKKKKMQEYFKKIHQEKLRDDIDFENDIRDRFKDVKYDPLDVEGNMQRIKEYNLQRQATITKQNMKSQNHFKKTQKNIQKFIMAYFYRQLFNPNQQMYSKIVIKSLKFNEKKTLVHVFWSFVSQKDDANQEQIKNYQRKLSDQSNYISGKMTQVLSLRYGPEIRFIYDRILPETQQIKKSLQQAKVQVLQYQLRNLTKKGHIQNTKQLKQMKKKLTTIADENIRGFNNRNKLLSKKYKQQQRQNIENSKRNKKVKKTADQKFWEHIDKL